MKASCTNVSSSLLASSSSNAFVSARGTTPTVPRRTLPAMRTPGSMATAIGFTVMLLSVSLGIHSSAGVFVLLLSFMGLLAGANLIAAGVCMADVPATTFPVAFGGARALATFVRRNAAAVGFVMVMASCAVTVFSGDARPVLCFGMFVLLLLGVSLINLGVRGE